MDRLAKRKEIIKKSINVILESQSEWGSFPASPEFPGFRFSWLRDGTYIAHSMLLHGHAGSCKKFLHSIHVEIVRCKAIVDKIYERLGRGEKLQPGEFLPARFTMDGYIEPRSENKEYFFAGVFNDVYSSEEGVDNKGQWQMFQIDSYGIWLWGLSRYLTETGDNAFLSECSESVSLTVRYLAAVWDMICYDPWEEYGSKQHVSSLACVCGGLAAINEFLKDGDIAKLCATVNKKIESSLLPDGTFPKYFGTENVDASLMWLAQPFKIFEPDDPRMAKTIRKIEERLLVNGGVKRYREDVYYGGGKWIVLTCWLGWYYTMTGKKDKAEALLSWCEDKVEDGYIFPEQVIEDVNFPEHINVWKEHCWPKSPSPLLWSHAMYLILCYALGFTDTKA